MTNTRGYTLLEAAIAMLLTALIASSVFTIAMSARRSSNKGLRKLAADQAARQLSDQLKNYVTGDRTATLANSGIAPPNPNGTGAQGWSLVTTNTADSLCGGTPCYALQEGTHVVTGILPTWFTSPPYSATLRYYVKEVYYFNGSVNVMSPWVNITVDWSEQ